VTTPSGTYTPTNIAQEFNPNNAAGHNVLGSTFPKNSYTVGGTTYAWDWRTNATFQAGWSVTSKVTCSDCHTGGTTTQAKGPHGSTARWMIDPQYTTQYRLANNASSISTTLLCVKCHANIRNANNVHSSSNHNVRCVRCHIGIPHGWKRPRMIVYASDPAPYKSPEFTTGMTGLTVRARAGGSYSWNSSSTDCATNCTTRHSAAAPYIP
jgi:ribosomal protein S27E